MKTVQVKDIVLGEGKPKICVPLTGKTRKELLDQAKKVQNSAAELVEWRIDCFEEWDDVSALETMSLQLRKILERIPLLITFRTKAEGGQREIRTEDYETLLTAVCEKKMADLIDIELFRGDAVVNRIRLAAQKMGMITVGSSHDFSKTPNRDEIVKRLCRMQTLGFHITKIAVMPRTERDVLVLLDAALAMKEIYADRPFIAISMDQTGMISRVAGEWVGSCLTFGTVGSESAPGQIDAASLNGMLELFHRN